MKLNKRICKQCMNVTDCETGNIVGQTHRPPLPWCQDDEKRWNNGKICCPMRGLEKTITKIPYDCRYKFEQMMYTGVFKCAASKFDVYEEKQ